LDEAIEIVKPYINVQSFNTLVKYIYAQCFLYKGEFDEYNKIFDEAIEGNDESTWRKLGLAAIHFQRA
jgi:hypothetical protein